MPAVSSTATSSQAFGLPAWVLLGSVGGAAGIAIVFADYVLQEVGREKQKREWESGRVRE